MSLSVFKEKILSEAAMEAKDIADKNSLTIEEERSRSARELRMLEEAQVAAAEKEGMQQRRSIHQQAEMQGRSLVLSAKQEELERTKEAFLSALTQLPKAEKKEIHAALMQLVFQEKGKVVPESDDNGFIYKGDGIEMNFTFPYLVDRLFWKYRSELAKELFS